VYQRGDIGNPIKMQREWKNSDFNFDDVSKGMLTLFTVATFEGWPGCVTSLSHLSTGAEPGNKKMDDSLDFSSLKIARSISV